MPRNRIEFWPVYHFADHPQIASKRPAFETLFDRYLSMLADVVSKPVTRAAQVRRYLLRACFRTTTQQGHFLSTTYARPAPIPAAFGMLWLF
jgi:hypothetical protein